jgi:ElaB/YqjD/DUF883 family membrane-anchored ribosome-binding protein
VVTGSNDVDEIFDRMAVIRRERHTNVSESVAGAEAVMDWGRYTWMYPWIAVGATATAGCLAYTGRHRRVAGEPASLDEPAGADRPITGVAHNGGKPSRIRGNLFFVAWDFLFPVVVRAGQNYMLHWLDYLQPTNTVGWAGLSASSQSTEPADGPGGASGQCAPAAASIETNFLEDRTMNDHDRGMKAEFTPQLDELKAMGRQDVAFARERLADGREMVRDYLVREPVKALGITLFIGVALGWLIRRP